MKFIKTNLGGVLVCAVIAAFAELFSTIQIGSFSFSLIGAPVAAIITGMIITLLAPKFSANKYFLGGIKFTSKKILQWAVIILGFSLNLGTIASVGGKSLPVIVSTISTSLITAFIVMKIAKIKPKTACLIGVGSSICGGSAIAATAPVIDADDEEIAQSISVIFLFNILAALIFPTFGHAVGFGTEGFAVFAGTAVNDTSSVTATAATAEKNLECKRYFVNSSNRKTDTHTCDNSDNTLSCNLQNTQGKINRSKRFIIFIQKDFPLVHPLFYRSVTCINTCRIHSAMFFYRILQQRFCTSDEMARNIFHFNGNGRNRT
jgi:hypothetical protein